MSYYSTRVKNIFNNLSREITSRPLALATILETRGSAPQVPGASAIFSTDGLLAGTLGGGVLEGDATAKSLNAIEDGSSFLYHFGLNEDINSTEGAICGGTATILVDANPDKDKKIFTRLDESLSENKSGILATIITKQDKVKIDRLWVEEETIKENKQLGDLSELRDECLSCLEKKLCVYLSVSNDTSVFLQPVYPLSKLIIAGAGHIGKALASMGSQLDFEVTIIDDRLEYGNSNNIPSADNIIVKPIGIALNEIPKTKDTYIVIVTRGHRDDSEALKACIHSNVPYIGMIGSKNKIQLMRDNFISKSWATKSDLDRIHAPIGLEIGSKTVQEIAVSISAQLIQIRSQNKKLNKNGLICGIILAAGESRRMGRPKMLLPFGNLSIIEKLVQSATRSFIDKTFVVLGSDKEAIGQLIQDYPVETVFNNLYRNGMLSSVQAGLKSVNEETTAIMVLLGDQPMIGSSIMNKMIETYRTSDKEIIVATYQGKRGHPLLFGKKYFRQVKELTVENSLKELLLNNPYDIEEMETDSSEILRDIDTEKEYIEELKHQSYYD